MIKTIIKALVIHKHELPSGHRKLSVLTSEQGLLRIMAFGAASSAHGRSAFSSPYCLATLLLEQRLPRDNPQLVDGYDATYFTNINTTLSFVARAALWSEVALATEAAGNDERLFYLYSTLFQALDRSLLPLPTLDFLFYYYFLLISGNLPSALKIEAPLHAALQQSPGMAMHYLHTHPSSPLPLAVIKALFTDSLPMPLKSLRLLEVYDDL